MSAEEKVSAEETLVDVAKTLATCLSESDHKLVFAESCTSGLLAATLSRVPGISKHFCGAFVTYRESLKQDALGVSPATLQQHTAVSAQASAEMLDGALSRCSEATLGLAITGHLGPGAPAASDGLVFIACGTIGETPQELRYQLKASERYERQVEAATVAIEQLHSFLSN